MASGNRGRRVCARKFDLQGVGGGGRSIDFFVVDCRISHGVRGVWTVIDVATSPHYIVVLRIAAVASRAMVRKIISPKRFEARPEIGCQRKVVEEVSCMPAISEMAANDSVDSTFECLVGKAERRLCRVFDKVLMDGTPDPSFMGRGRTLERKMRPAIWPRACEHGTADKVMLGLKVVHLRF